MISKRQHVSSVLHYRDILYIALALAGILIYGFQTWGQVHSQISVIDEGLYLFKGLLFVGGEYKPYQDYGLLTNHMPLSFLIPGWIQSAFGPGIRTGRYASFLLGLLMLAGLWLLTRRFTGFAWANIPVWGIALNPALQKIFSQAISQVLVAAMLVWVLVLILGKSRSPLELIAGSALAAVLGVTRLNMLPVWFGLVLYIGWQHGRRAALYSFATGSALLAVVHLLYWPGILKLWAAWIPERISPFLQAYRLTGSLSPAWNPQFNLGHRLDSLLSSTRMQLVPLMGWLMSVLALFFRRKQLERQDLKILVFGTGLFALLYGIHAIASAGGNYCVYCLTNYIAFFSPLGLFLLALSGREIVASHDLRLQSGAVSVAATVPFMLGLPTGIPLVRTLLKNAVPVSLDGTFHVGTLPLENYLEFRYAIHPVMVLNATQVIYYGVASLLLCLLVLSFARRKRSGVGNERVFGFHSAVGACLFFLLGTASLAFGSRYTNYDCGLDEIARIEAIGNELNRQIPAGSQIYWGTARSPVPLLYLDEVQIFPPQLNGAYSYFTGGSTDQLLKLGYWNEQAARAWMDQADYLILDVRSVVSSFQPLQDQTGWRPIFTTPSTNPCDPQSSILVLGRIE